MSLLFVCDHIFLTQGTKVYSNTFSYEILKRYVEVFTHVTVIGRKLETHTPPEMLFASGEGISFEFMENISTLKSFFGLRQRHEKTIEKILEAHEAVIVRLPGELGLLTAKVAHRMHKKCLTEVVGCAWDVMWNYGGLKAKLYAPFFFLRTKKSVKYSEHTVYVTQKFLQKRYPSSQKAIVANIANVELPEYENTVLLARMKKIEKEEDKMVFGSIGYLSVKYKGIESALQMLKKIAQTGKDFEYRILGEGDPMAYRLLAEKLEIADKVFFDGILPGGEAVRKWLDEIDILLHPSIAEGMPRALIEAMSRGCPVVASSVGGIPELLEEKMLFNHGENERFFTIVKTLMQNREERKQVAQHNFYEAKKYQKHILNHKRRKFLLEFKESV